MKTLKKTLCLVLAVVMVVGVLVLPANAAATTAADTEATAAFNTLNKYGVMNGVDANNTPALDKNINRQDMAAIIYRIMTGDTAGTYVANYAGSANGFADSATFATWAKGYIGYVRTNGIFVGDNNGNFKPTEEITGYDVLTVLLRCLGYGQNGEFTGAAYAQNALTAAAQINMFGGATNFKNVTEDMSKVINRGIVAKLTFNAIQAPIAVYYNGTYSVYQDNQGRPSAPGIGTPNPSLVVYDDGAAMSSDKWGAPVIEYDPVISFTKSYNSAPKHLGKYTEVVPFMGEYFVATTECDVSEDGGVTGTAVLTNYLNGVKQDDLTIQATDTVGTVGAQGQWTRTYDVDGNGVIDRVVRIDTLLAQVIEVVKEEKDPAGHIKVAASLKLHVYYDGSSPVTAIEKDINYAVKGNDYSKGDFILLRAVATNDTTLSVVDEVSKLGTYYEIIGAAPQFPGAQTTIWYNQASHVIDGKTYPDNNKYILDVAGNTGDTFIWFTDSNGNIIGSIKPDDAPASYAILKNMIWKTGNPGHAEATLLYMDGTEATVTVASIDGGENPYAETTADDAVPTATDGSATEVKFDTDKAYVSDEGSLNGMYKGYALYAVTVKSNGSVKLDAADFEDSDTQLVAKDIKLITASGSEKYVSDNTVFIYKNADGTYTRVVGKDNILGRNTPSIFYVDTNTDNVAEYVYVASGDPTSETLSHLVASLNGKYTKGLYENEKIWTLDKAFVGGKEVATGTIYAKKEDHIKTLAGAVGELYWVDYTSGEVKDEEPTAVDTTGHKLNETGAPSDYDTDAAVYRLADDVEISVSGGILSISKIGDSKTNIVIAVSDLKTIYGADKDTLADVEWSKVNAYAVVDIKDAKGVVTDLYILTPPDGTIEPDEDEPEPSTTSGVTLEEIKCTNDGSAIKLNIKLKDGGSDEVGSKDVVVSGTIQALSRDAKWEDVETFSVTASDFVSDTAKDVTIWDGALSEMLTYRVTYTITVDGKTVVTTSDTLGVPNKTA